jgi:hypothetical protein
MYEWVGPEIFGLGLDDLGFGLFQAWMFKT